MAITDELREYAKSSCGVMYSAYQVILAIADRIDAENERECHEQYVCGAEHGIGASIEASMIQERGYIELPKDANGEAIHIGDTVEWVDEPHHPITVVGVGKNTLFYIDDDANVLWTMAITKRHHAKTIEEVLDELLQRFAEDGYDGCTADLVAEYAAKLQLREES